MPDVFTQTFYRKRQAVEAVQLTEGNAYQIVAWTGNRYHWRPAGLYEMDKLWARPGMVIVKSRDGNFSAMTLSSFTQEYEG